MGLRGNGARRLVALVASLTLVAALAACGDNDDGERASSGDDGGADTEVTVSPGCDGGEGTDGPQELAQGDLTRTYVVHLPDDYDPDRPAPLVYNLHGLTSNIEQQDAYSLLPDLAGPRGYIVVTPQGEPLRVSEFAGEPFWNVIVSAVELPDGSGETIESSEIGADDVGFFTELTELLLDSYCVDESRVFSTGMSNGAGMSTVIGCELDGRVKAIGPVAGVNLTDTCTGEEPVSVIAFHGDADDIVHYDGNFLAGFQLGNPSVPDRMAQWAEHNGCDPEPVVEDDGDGIVVTRWESCDEGAAVELWTLAGWGHAWPRAEETTGPGSIDATTTVLDFFDRVSVS